MKTKKSIRPARQETFAPEVASQEALEKVLHVHKIDECIFCIDSWTILEEISIAIALKML
jgi:hypothetical protein